MKTTPEIEELKRIVEEKRGKALTTTTAFEEFTIVVKRMTNENISAATLKRLWGYVADEHTPRISTLDILSRYIGHNSFKSFCQWLKSTGTIESSFFLSDQVMSTDLTPGQQLIIGWSPNRSVRLSYQGESTYQVLSSENSKLQVGDRFLCGNFMLGYPLYLPYLERNGEQTPSYVAGRNGGLTILRVEL